VAVLVATRGRRVPTLARHLAQRARRLMAELGLQTAELSLVLVSDAVMHDLNRRWRKKDRPTDVLAFAQCEERVGAAGWAWGVPPRARAGESRSERRRRPPGPPRPAPTDGLHQALLGDVVISVDTARRQAEELGHSLGAESERLLVHGLLHLLGYDHERSTADARRMQRKERALLRALDA
jgi:probable rRNA maturation factor